MSLDNLTRWTDDELWRERAVLEAEGDDGSGVVVWALLAMAALVALGGYFTWLVL